MATDGQDEAYEKILTANLQRTIEFLKYAEAKNGALLTFVSAWILAITNLLLGSKQLAQGMEAAFSTALLPLVLSGILAIASFFPRMNASRFLRGGRADPYPRNLLYFGDIAAMTPVEFESAIDERYRPSAGRTTTAEYLCDLTVQILINSQITRRKMRLFQWSLGFLALAAAISVFPVAAVAIQNLAAY